MHYFVIENNILCLNVKHKLPCFIASIRRYETLKCKNSSRYIKYRQIYRFNQFSNRKYINQLTVLIVYSFTNICKLSPFESIFQIFRAYCVLIRFAMKVLNIFSPSFCENQIIFPFLSDLMATFLKSFAHYTIKHNTLMSA